MTSVQRNQLHRPGADRQADHYPQADTFLLFRMDPARDQRAQNTRVAGWCRLGPRSS
jgi:hypothetical protein